MTKSLSSVGTAFKVLLCVVLVTGCQSGGETDSGVRVDDSVGKLPALSAPRLGNHEQTWVLPANKTVILNMWASWCGPCRTEIPILQTIQTDYGRACNLDVVGVNQQDFESSAMAFLKAQKITYTNIWDPDSALTLELPAELRPPFIPATIVIARGRDPHTLFPGEVTYSAIRDAVNQATGTNCMN